MQESIIILLLLGLIIAIIIVYMITSSSEFDDQTLIIKYRGDNQVGRQVGGKVKVFPVRERIQTLNLEHQTIHLQKNLIVDDNDNLIEFVGDLTFTMKNDPDKFLNLINNKSARDTTDLIIAVMKQKIYQIIRTDIWGLTKIDLMKNEKRTLRKLEDNIKYNLELNEDDIVNFDIGFILE